MTKKRVMALAEAAGAEVFDDSQPGELAVSIWTPQGTAWVATGCHVLSAHYMSDPAAGWHALVEDMSQGTMPCPTNPEECDTCSGQ